MVEARNRSNKSNKKSVKSKELRKYEVAYNKCIKLCLKSKYSFSVMFVSEKNTCFSSVFIFIKINKNYKSIMN